MELKQCEECEREPNLKHNSDFTSYWMECPECNCKTDSSSTPQGAAEHWNDSEPADDEDDLGEEISGYKRKYPVQDYIDAAAWLISRTEDSSGDVTIKDDDPETGGEDDCVMVAAEIIVSDGDVERMKKYKR